MRSFATMMENTMDKSRQDSDSTTLKIVERINIAHDPEAKLSKFKDVTASTTVEYVLTQWTLDFQRQEREPLSKIRTTRTITLDIAIDGDILRLSGNLCDAHIANVFENAFPLQTIESSIYRRGLLIVVECITERLHQIFHTQLDRGWSGGEKVLLVH